MFKQETWRRAGAIANHLNEFRGAFERLNRRIESLYRPPLWPSSQAPESVKQSTEESAPSPLMDKASARCFKGSAVDRQKASAKSSSLYCGRQNSFTRHSNNKSSAWKDATIAIGYRLNIAGQWLSNPKAGSRCHNGDKLTQFLSGNHAHLFANFLKRWFICA